jgi:hypothetical protein
MTKKHYKQIANTLSIIYAQDQANFEMSENGHRKRTSVCEQFSHIADSLCNFFESDNPRFDRKKFLDAVEGKGYNDNDKPSLIRYTHNNY